MMRVVVSTSAAARLEAAARFVAGYPPSTEIVVVGAARGAADDFARGLARRAGATFGLTRFSLTELAARLAAAGGTGVRRAPGTAAGGEAAATRAAYDARSAGELEYFGPVASMPGFPRALARTAYELRLAGVDADRVTAVRADASRRDLGRLLARVEGEFDRAGVGDRAELFGAAAETCRAGAARWTGLPLVLLDLPLDSRAEQAFVAALSARAPAVMAAVPGEDRVALDALVAMGGEVGTEADAALPESDLAHLRRFVFTPERPPVRERTGDVRLFSAPGEGREAVEIVRRMLDEAARGVPFDEMAVFVRAPQHYLGLLEHACSRGNVPVYFERGTSRPDPSGRALLALLSCAVEGLSARRFDEYLSLGQVPQMAGGAGGERLRPQPVIPHGDEFSEFRIGEEPEGVDAAEEADDAASASVADTDDEAVVAGTLRSPWKWEELVVESAVVGGRTRADGRERWRRRLAGLAADFRYRIEELRRDEPDSARIARYERDLRNLAHLQSFALPLIDRIAAWPGHATWGEWIDAFTGLASEALKQPERVLELLAELRPMAAVGSVSLEEARDVLHPRLVSLDRRPGRRRYGQVFVGSPHEARGRTFRVVFIPGLAERIVPQRPREDPLLLDARRRDVDAGLVGQDERAAAERLLLRIAMGAAGERLYLSYPRLDVAESRARVPSFYALDVMRAVTGVVPDHRLLAADAAEESGVHLAWPAPADADRAIDDLEHDLASLRPLLESRDPASVRGHAHYLLGLNEALRRSVVSRWLRGKPAWSPGDGIVTVTPEVAPALDAARLVKRPYSLSALQRFSACPYQFLLGAVHRLEPWDDPEPIVRMDPLTRGSLFHAVQTEFFRELHAARALPVTAPTLVAALRTLDAVLDRVSARYAEELAPAIERVWDDEIVDLRRDLVIWVQRMVEDDEWVPRHFEWSFGLRAEGRDPDSRPEPVVLAGGFRLRGSVDLIETRTGDGLLRVTDHKTGRNRSNPELIVGGGAVLQPVLYGMAVEEGLGRPVVSGRLYYCTTTGGFARHEIPLTEAVRARGLEVLAIVDRAVEQGFLAAAPDEGACAWCDFRPVCGPREEERIGRKLPGRLADLVALREMA